MDQDPNAGSSPETNINGFHRNPEPTYQLAMQAQMMQWVAAMQNPYASQLQNSSFLQQPQRPTLPNGAVAMSSLQQNPFLDQSGVTLSANAADNVFRMIFPVGSSLNDDSLLAQAIHDSAMNGKTYRQAIEGLHGLNNHPAHLWKDYYLDHRPRILGLVSRIPKQYSKTAQKHFSPTPLAINAKDPSNNNIAPDARKSPTKINDQRKPVGRTTINSITAHPPPPSDPYARITIPSPLSREPSPPSRVVASGLKGNMFTQDDTDFMVKFISWELQRNPALTKSNLSYKLEAKAPHHPFSSWMQHIRSAWPTIDKIIAVARGKIENNLSSEDQAESNIKFESDSGWHSGSDSRAIVAEFDEDSADDDVNMGLPGKNYTAADRRLLAKYIASVDDWDYLEDSIRFATFHQCHPHRALTSWSRYYSRNEKGAEASFDEKIADPDAIIFAEIDRLAKRYKRRAEVNVPDATSRGRPSWVSSSSNGSLPSALKRKFGNGGFDADRSEFRRQKGQSTTRTK